MKFLTSSGYLYYVNGLGFEQASSTLTEYASDINITSMLIEKPFFNVTNYCKNYSSQMSTLNYNNFD